jgi:hypothetical protein
MASRIETGSEQNKEQGSKLRGWLLAAAGVVVVAAATVGILRWQVSDDATTSEPAAVTTAATTADLPPVTVREREQPVIYIVATQEDAELQHRAIAEADTIRYTMGLPPIETSVFVAATPEEADGFIQATLSVNQIRESEGLLLYRLVDLRR